MEQLSPPLPLLNAPKGAQIAATMKENKLRREGMVKRCFELKVTDNKLSEQKRDALAGDFREAKWLRNYVVGLADAFSITTLGESVPVNVFNPKTQECDIVEVRTFLSLGSQMKQSLVKQVQQDIINLSKKKAKGGKVGRLRFTKEVNCIPLKQHGITYTVTRSGVKLQNVGLLKVKGLDQIFDAQGDPIGEIAQGWLIRRPSGYYFKVLTYLPKTEEHCPTPTLPAIGIDFGVDHPIVLSDGTIPDLCVAYPDILRKAHQAVSHAKKGSKRRLKALARLRVLSERYSAQKRDRANQLIHVLKQHTLVGIQDDYLAAWWRLWGRKLGESTLGSIKSRIQALQTSETISRFLPTTQLCPQCLEKNCIPLDERTYRCSCGFVEDRDVKAAKIICCYAIYQREHPGRELIGLSAEALATVISIYWEISLPVDAGSPAL